MAGTGGRSFRGAGGPARKASLGRVTDVALGPGGSVYALASNRVVRISRTGRLAVVARFRAALGLAVDSRGRVYVTDAEGGRLLRFDPSSKRVTSIVSGLDQPIGVALGPDGSVYVSSGHDGGGVDRIAPDGARTTVVNGLALAAFVTALGDGSLLVVDHVRHDAPGRVLQVAPDGTVTTLSEGEITAPMSAAAARDGRIYVTSFDRPPLGRLDLATGRLVPLGARSLAVSTPAPRARLLSPRRAVAGRAWRAVVEVKGSVPGPPILRAAQAGRSRAAKMQRAGRSRWATTLTFPGAGSWRLSLRIGARSFPLGSLAVAEAPIAVTAPMRLALESSGTLLVADGGANRIVRIDPRTGRTSVVAQALTRPVSVAAGPAGAIYALADERLYRIEAGRATELMAFTAEGPTDLAVTPTGDVYLSRYGDHVDLFSGGVVRVVARGFDRPHGVTLAPDGAIVVADTYAGAVRRVAVDGSVTTLATGFTNPIDVALDLDGSILVVERGALSRVSNDGAVTVVTNRLVGPSGVVVAPDGAIYVSDLEGPVGVGRVDRETGAVTSVTG